MGDTSKLRGDLNKAELSPRAAQWVLCAVEKDGIEKYLDSQIVHSSTMPRMGIIDNPTMLLVDLEATTRANVWPPPPTGHRLAFPIPNDCRYVVLVSPQNTALAYVRQIQEVSRKR